MDDSGDGRSDIGRTRFAKCLKALEGTSFMGSEDVPDSFASMLDYYRRQTRWKRRCFRTAGITLMALGAALPVVAAFGDNLRWISSVLNKNVAVSIMSAAIAFLTGLLSHFRWDVGWRAQTEALFALRAEKTAWENAVVIAKLQPNEEEAVTMLGQAFEQLRTRAFEVTRDERGKFFKAAQPPQVKPLTVTADD